jgi:hypothetical protein
MRTWSSCDEYDTTDEDLRLAAGPQKEEALVGDEALDDANDLLPLTLTPGAVSVAYSELRPESLARFA